MARIHPTRLIVKCPNWLGDLMMALPTLKSIRSKPYFEYAASVKEIMKQHNIDTIAIQSLIYYGDVNFTKENRGKKPCHTYLIEPTKKTANISIRVKRCDSVATVVGLMINNGANVSEDSAN